MIDGDMEATVTRTYSRYGRSRRARRKWAASNRGNREIRRELAAAAVEQAATVLGPQSEVLDSGCGNGWWLRQLAEEGVPVDQLHGVDLIGPRVEAARRTLPGADVQKSDIRHLPYSSGRFDLVTSFTVLSSLPNPKEVTGAIEELWRVVAPGGLMLIYEPRVPNPWNRHTLHVTRDLLDALPAPTSSRSLTLLPILARHLGPGTAKMYPVLGRAAFLRTHRLTSWRKSAA